jgi:long-subunit acyl-CoA synthetase (AMP-forming)
MTEVGSATTQRPGLIDFGTLGPAAPGYELRIAMDGELLVRSPYTASKYRNRTQESAETFATDGCFLGTELTETFKLRRGYVNERYASAVERMYGSS